MVAGSWARDTRTGKGKGGKRMEIKEERKEGK